MRRTVLMICLAFAAFYVAAVAHLWRMVGRELVVAWPLALMGLDDE